MTARKSPERLNAAIGETRKNNIPDRWEEAHAAAGRPTRETMGGGTPMQDYFKSFHREGFAYYAPIVKSLDDMSELKRLERGLYYPVADDSGNIVSYQSGNDLHVLVETKQKYKDQAMAEREMKIAATESNKAILGKDSSLHAKEDQKIISSRMLSS